MNDQNGYLNKRDRRVCNACGEVKDNKDFLTKKQGGKLEVGKWTINTCYQCEGLLWNPIITKSLVMHA